ncbi:type II toxin-antitoxin system RelB family antitoxin [Faecalibaculum rodentium]|uniref:type II toxin-antitoxin system RelB family antitoxin n=1 Tax=Faecalibaculum rodentium TaxID=1702221 RepID=UPI0023F4B77C|nr:DUF6290 family protein [Faecalibaculum rodentium]
MISRTKSTTIRFDSEVLNLIHKEAALNGQTGTEFMRNAVLEKLEDSLDYRDAAKNLKESGGRSLSREEVIRNLGF